MPDVGHVERDPHKKKKRTAVIVIAGVFLVACVIAVALGLKSTKQNEELLDDHDIYEAQVKSTMKSVQTLCKPAEYKETCIKSLFKVAKNTSDPKEIIKAGFELTIKDMKDAVEDTRRLQDLANDTDSREALRVCRRLIHFAIEDLKHALDEANKFDVSNLDNYAYELKVWLSGALTFQGTCLDGFENANSNASMTMKKSLESSIELSRNALDIIDHIHAVVASFGMKTFSRRLLSDGAEYNKVAQDGFPPWVTPTQRTLLEANLADIKPNIVVAKDGSGKYNTINQALTEVPEKNLKTFVIYIKEGVYPETVDIKMRNVMLIGDGPLKTKIIGKKSSVDFKTIETATCVATGHGFIAKNIGFENAAGPTHEAVALRIHSDKAVIYNCQIDGHHNTLYAHAHRQFYRDCTISGTVDFLFGNAAAILQNCKLVVRKPTDNQENTVTAQSREVPAEDTGFILQACTITADQEYFPLRHTIRTFIGRAWRNASRTIVMNTHMDDFIDPEGYSIKPNSTHQETCYFAEFQNKGPGAADLSRRVKWAGVKTTITKEEAMKYTPKAFFRQDDWVKATGVPYEPGMMNPVEPQAQPLPQPKAQPELPQPQLPKPQLPESQPQLPEPQPQLQELQPQQSHPV